MQKSNDQSRLVKPASYKRWVGVFWLLVILMAGGFYYATQKIAYTWRWNRVPIYFAYKDTIEIISDIDGDVESIIKSGKEAVITVPAESLGVVEGEFISLGDTLGTYSEWKYGLLILGLWMTLKLSIIATIAGIIIGVIGGIARISSNPALKWASIVYVEIIRGSPLMVQILIWYFVFGTVINDLLAAYGLGRLPTFWYGVASLKLCGPAYSPSTRGRPKPPDPWA